MVRVAWVALLSAAMARMDLSGGMYEAPSVVHIWEPSHLAEQPRLRFLATAVIAFMLVVSQCHAASSLTILSTPMTTMIGSSVYM